MTYSKALVLVVEDQEIWREQSLGEPLQELGVTVFFASNKEEALALLDLHRFDLAIIDLNLTEVPGNRDGVYVADYIESKGTKMPIIVISGSEDGLRALRERPRKIFAQIRKDRFDLDIFVNQVKAALNTSGI